MAIVKMKKLSLSVYDNLRDKMMADLQKVGCFHPEYVEYEDDADFTPVFIDNEETDFLINEINDVVLFLESHIPEEKKGFFEKLGEAPPIVSVARMKEIYSRFELELTLRDIRSVEKNYKENLAKLDALLKEKEDLTMWREAGVDLDIINGKSEYLAAITGYIPSSTYEDFVNALRASSPYVEIFKAFTTVSDTYVYIVFLREVSETIHDTLKDLSFAPVHISTRTGNLVEVLDDIDEQIVKFSSRIEIQRLFIIDFTHFIDTLKIICDFLIINRKRLEAQGKGAKTESVSFYGGWIPAKKEADVRAILDNYTEIDYSIEDPTDEEFEQVPVALEAKLLSKPFEVLTRMYGLPAYGNSVDPTPHLSPFYFIFYGFCLSDFFYGLIMFVAFGLLARKSRKKPAMSNFMMFLSLAGFSAMIFGVLFGSFFGDLFTHPGYFYSEFFANIGLIDTLESPMLVLYLALILGAIQLIYGLFLNMFIQMKTEVIPALWDNLSWIIFLFGFFGWAVLVWLAGLAGIPTLGPVGVQIAVYLMIGGAGLIVLNGVRKAKKTIGAKIAGFLGGLYDLYGATGYISNLLSYARLLALGLATGVIASVFNYLGFMVLGDSPNPFTAIIMVVILIFGHVFNLVLSAFGAFVHSLRLQFVEFFSRFIRSGGKDYEPLREEGVYNQVESLEAVRK